MPDTDALARRAADVVANVAARAGGLVTWFTIVAVFIVVGAFWAGLEALDGGVRTVWIVLGAVFGWIALVGLIRLRWNLGAVRRNADALVDEVRRIIENDPGTERTVIEATETGERADGRVLMVFSQQFSGLGPALGPDRRNYRWLPRTIDTMRTGIFTLAKAFVICCMFAVLGLIFLIALAL